jgi:site-specific recombinase XerD
MRQLQSVCRHAAEAAGRDKTATVHRLPNCFATQFLNRRLDSRAIQALLEHRHINVICLYARVATNRKIQSSIELPTMQWLAA